MERAIGLLKKFQYLQTTVPIQQADLLDNVMIKISGCNDNNFLNQKIVSYCPNIYNIQKNLITQKCMSTMKSEKFGSQLEWKSETWFFTFLHVYVSWIEQDKILISQLFPPKLTYFVQTRKDQKWDPMKRNFDIFEIQK